MASRIARKGTSRYKIRNWKQYEAGLIQRGSISFWINDDAIDQWNPEAKDKTRGRQEEYNDLAIQICLTFSLLYRQALRQTEGFINSLLKLMDLDLISPDHRHWCTNRHFDKNIVGLLFFHHFHLKIWLSWHLAQQGKVQVVIK